MMQEILLGMSFSMLQEVGLWQVCRIGVLTLKWWTWCRREWGLWEVCRSIPLVGCHLNFR
jgi:hypothetical protein